MSDLRSGVLKRDISFAGSAFLAFNGVVGAGIFALPGNLADQFGAFSPLLFPLFGVLALLIALPLARLAAATSMSGGPVAYTAAAFGPVAGFQIGWLFYVARATAVAANTNLLVDYAAGFWSPLSAGIGHQIGIVFVISMLTLINVVGVRRAIRALDTLTLLKALPLVAMAVTGLFVFGDRLAMPSSMPKLDTVEAAALLILYAFVGFENILVPAEETHDARRTIPRALIGTVLATAALYLLIQLAYVAVIEPGAGGDTPLVALGTVVAGPAGAVVIGLTALASLAGNLTSSVIASPRITYALGATGSLPTWFARIQPRFGTPANSILFYGAISALLALSGGFAVLAVASTVARLVVYAVSIAALPKLAPASRLATTALVGGGLAVCAWGMAQSGWESWRLLLALVVLGGLLYAVARSSAVFGVRQ